jgi:hypothetical protein
LVARDAVGVQRKRPAVGKSPQVAAVNAALVFVACNGLQKGAPPLQAAVAALDALTLDGHRHLFEAKKTSLK